MNKRMYNTREELIAAGVPDTPALDRLLARHGGVLPVLAGGAEPATYPDAVTDPLGSPSVSGTTYTVDFLLQDVTRISRLISDLMLQRFFVDQIFAGGGTITGGAVIFDRATRNELYATRDVQERLPGESYPNLEFDRTGPFVEKVRDFGGKFWVEDEVKRRNNMARVTQAMTRTSNTIRRKIQTLAIAKLEEAIAEYERAVEGVSWKDATETSLTTRTGADTPYADLTAVTQHAEEQELGYVYDMAIMNPRQWRDFVLGVAGGEDAAAKAALSDNGIESVWVTNRKTPGSVLWVARQMPGECSYEQGMTTEVIDDREHKRTGYQSFIVPVIAVTDPYAVLETTGHEA